MKHQQCHDETFSHVAHITTVRTLFIVASICVGSISQLDVKNAFLNGKLHEEVYKRPPPRNLVPNGNGLSSSLFSLWHQTKILVVGFSDLPLLSLLLVFSLSAHDTALFIHASSRGRSLLLYVGDMIITGDNYEYIAFVKACPNEQFLMRGPSDHSHA